MSVLYPDQEPPAPAGTACYYCAGALDLAYPVVLWHSEASPLTLHSLCAGQLGAHLIADGREAELAAGTVTHWAQRGARVGLEPFHRQARAGGTPLP